MLWTINKLIKSSPWKKLIGEINKNINKIKYGSDGRSNGRSPADPTGSSPREAEKDKELKILLNKNIQEKKKLFKLEYKEKLRKL